MDDEGIIQLYFARAESAVSETKAKYGRMCRGIAFGILKSREDAEECENDTYLRAWNTIPPERPNILSAFLGRITRNLALDRYEYLRAEKRGGGEIPLLLDELAECIASPERFDGAEDGELRETLNGFLASLSADARKIFLRRYWFGDQVSDIARRFSFSQSKVKMSLMRSRGELREALMKEGIAV